MGILDIFFKKPFGNINPDDPSSYSTAYTEYMQAQMEGDAAVEAFYKRWNVKGEDHWSEIEVRMIQNGQHIAAAQHAGQAQMNQAYATAGLDAPVDVDGMGLQQYALLMVRLERAQSPDERERCLRGFGCDEARFSRIQAGFGQHMNPQSPRGAQVGVEFQMHLSIARSAPNV